MNPEKAPTPTREAIYSQIQGFLRSKSRLLREQPTIDPHLSLFASGMFDSLFFVQLVVFLEKTFAVRLSDPGRVSMRHMDSLSLIADVVADAAHR